MDSVLSEKNAMHVTQHDLETGSVESTPHPVEVTSPPSDPITDDKEIEAKEERVDNSSDFRIPTWRVIVLLVSLSIGLFLSLLDTSIVATAIYSIGTEFDALTSATWAALAYTLSYVGCAVLFTRLSDVTGRRNAYAAAFIIFFAFSIGCGFAKTLNQLVVCRALQGIGGSGLYSLAMVIFPEITPPKLLPMIGSIAGMVVAISGVCGPVIGGLITRYTTWRWVFWINAPIGITPLILLFIAWPPKEQMRPAERRSLRHVDFVGAALLIAASVLVVLSFQEGGLGTTSKVWQSAIFLGPLVAGCACWALLFSWEAVVEKFISIPPLLPLELLANRVYAAGALCTVTTGFVYFIIIYSLPLHFQVVYGKSALVAGISLLPLLGSAAVGSMLGGAASAKRNNTFPTMVIAHILMAIGTGLLSTITDLSVDSKVYGYQVLVGFGFGLSVSNVTFLAILHSEPRDSAVSQGIMAQARVFGGSIGIAASTAILGVVQRRQLHNVAGSSSSSAMPSSAQAHHAVQQAYADAFQETMRITAIVACASFVLCLGTFERHPTAVPSRK